MLDQPPHDTVPLTLHQRSHGVGRLAVKCVGRETRIENLYQEGCAKLRLPTLSDDGLQAVMINSSGGMTGGDRLNWSFDLRQDTALTVTTQACERIYAASHDVARTNISLSVGKGAKLAWLPQETILFDRGSFARRIEVDLANNAELLMVEPLIFGRQAMGEKVLNGRLADSWRIRCNGRMLHAEETLFDGPINDRLCAAAITSGQIAAATLLLVANHSEGLVGPVRKILGTDGGASYWDGRLLARIIATDGYSLRKKLVPLIKLLNREAPLPKVWAL